MRKNLNILAVALTVLFLCPLAALAYTYDTTVWNDANATYGLKVKADGVLYNYSAAVGDFSVEFDDGSNTQWIQTFCIEPNQEAYIGSKDIDVEVAGLGTITGGYQAAWLVEYASDYSAGYTEKEQIGALQLAIWEVITEDDGVYDLGSGDFIVYSSKGLGTLASVYLEALENNFATADLAYLDSNYAAGISPTHQDFILKGVSASSVPEPGTMLLVGLGLIGIAGVRRKVSK